VRLGTSTKGATVPNGWMSHIITALLSGGSATILGAIIQARLTARKLRMEEQTAPAQREAIFLGSAEKAVAALVVSLDRAQLEIEELKQELDEERERSREKDQRIVELEQLLAQMRRELDRLQATVAQARVIANEIASDSTENPPG
jgi:chromosome segregation ATPase